MKKAMKAVKKAKTMKLVIDRNVWLRGEGSDRSALLRPTDGKMCCVGIYLKALGVPEDELLKDKTARFIKSDLVPEWTRCAPGEKPYPVVSELYQINDGANLGFSEAERERLIAERFAKHGVKVKFVN